MASEGVGLGRSRTKEPLQRLPFQRPSGLWHRLVRAVRFRLIVPIMRSRHSPEHTARGVMVGLVCACLPSPIGQMGTRQPGKVGSSTMINASSGSPSGEWVPGMKP